MEENYQQSIQDNCDTTKTENNYSQMSHSQLGSQQACCYYSKSSSRFTETGWHITNKTHVIKVKVKQSSQHQTWEEA